MSCSSAPSSIRSSTRAARDLAVEAVGGADRRRLGHRLERVTVDGEAVVRVALRPRPHVLPFREQSHEHADVIERFEHGDRARPAASNVDEGVARRGRPLHDAEVADPSERVTIDRQTQLRRARRERRARATRRPPRRARARSGRRGRRCRRRACARHPSGRRDRSGSASSRDQRSDVIQTTARADSPSSRTSASASSASTRRATASWSCSVSRSDRPPVTRCSATRASSNRSRASRRRVRSSSRR